MNQAFAAGAANAANGGQGALQVEAIGGLGEESSSVQELVTFGSLPSDAILRCDMSLEDPSGWAHPTSSANALAGDGAEELLELTGSFTDSDNENYHILAPPQIDRIAKSVWMAGRRLIYKLPNSTEAEFVRIPLDHTIAAPGERMTEFHYVCAMVVLRDIQAWTGDWTVEVPYGPEHDLVNAMYNVMRGMYLSNFNN